MMAQVIYWTGVAVCAAGGISIVALALIGCAMVSNRAQNMLLQSYGGWKVFMEYRDWYHNHRAPAQAADRALASPASKDGGEHADKA